MDGLGFDFVEGSLGVLLRTNGTDKEHDGSQQKVGKTE